MSNSMDNPMSSALPWKYISSFELPIRYGMKRHGINPSWPSYCFSDFAISLMCERSLIFSLRPCCSFATRAYTSAIGSSGFNSVPFVTDISTSSGASVYFCWR